MTSGLPGHGLTYSGLRGFLVLGCRVAEVSFSDQTGTDWCASCTGMSQLQFAACDKEEACSVLIVLLPHLHLLVHTLLVRLGQAGNGSSCLAVAPV